MYLLHKGGGWLLIGRKELAHGPTMAACCRWAAEASATAAGRVQGRTTLMCFPQLPPLPCAQAGQPATLFVNKAQSHVLAGQRGQLKVRPSLVAGSPAL